MALANRTSYEACFRNRGLNRILQGKDRLGLAKMVGLALAGSLFLASCESSPAPAWAVESQEIPASVVADAIYRAEGGAKTRHPYGVLSVRVSGEAEARQVCLNSIRNSRARWVKAGRPGDWLAYFASRWAPTKGASNDPTGLNSNWLRNVRAILGRYS